MDKTDRLLLTIATVLIILGVAVFMYFKIVVNGPLWPGISIFIVACFLLQIIKERNGKE